MADLQRFTLPYAALVAQGKTPVAAEYSPENGNFFWIMDDGKREQLNLLEKESREDIKPALDHLVGFCAANDHPKFTYKIL